MMVHRKRNDIAAYEVDPDNQLMIQSLRSISEHFGMFAISEAVECEGESQRLSEMMVDC
jgi:EAL domain-containing protein (putative c-di-GMP-specific phosphodiesterase class I)